MRQVSDQISPREYEEYNQQKEMLELQMAHAKEMKLLELEVQKLEAKWSSWIKIPVTIITLPVRILFVIPLSIYAATKRKVPEEYWKFLR